MSPSSNSIHWDPSPPLIFSTVQLKSTNPNSIFHLHPTGYSNLNTLFINYLPRVHLSLTYNTLYPKISLLDPSSTTNPRAHSVTTTTAENAHRRVPSVPAKWDCIIPAHGVQQTFQSRNEVFKAASSVPLASRTPCMESNAEGTWVNAGVEPAAGK